MIEGEKVTLRKLEEKDLAKKVEWINNPKINKTLMYDIPLTLDKTKEWFKNTLTDKTRHDFAIIEKETGNFIGVTGLRRIDDRHKRGQFYITIGDQSKWGKGYANEAVILVLKFAFSEGGLEKVYLFTLDNNTRARELYERIGFEKEALMKKHFFIHGKLYDLYQHAFLKDDFKKKYGR